MNTSTIVVPQIPKTADQNLSRTIALPTAEEQAAIVALQNILAQPTDKLKGILRFGGLPQMGWM